MKFQQQYTQKQKQVQSQKLVLTQQLQQSIQVLQFSSDELNQFVEEFELFRGPKAPFRCHSKSKKVGE